MQDPLRAVLDSVFAAPAYEWQVRPDPFAFLRRWGSFLFDRLVGWGDAHPQAVRLIAWTLLALLALLLARAILAVVRGFRVAPGGTGALGSVLVRDSAWYRREAERLASEGRLLEAMQADFTALMLELDRRHLLRFHPSKTPREYVREVQLAEPSRAELSELVWSLYRHLFAREPLTPPAAAAWRARTAADRYAPAR